MRMPLIVAVATAFLAGKAVVARFDVLKVGDSLTEFDVATDATGKPVRLASYKGQWVVVATGAAWCKACAKELQTWDKLAGELKGRAIFVALDIDDDIEVGKRFHDRLKLRNMVRAYLPAEKSGVVGQYGSEHLPSTIVADRQHIVRLVRAGFEVRDTDGEYQRFKDALLKLVK